MKAISCLLYAFFLIILTAGLHWTFGFENAVLLMLLVIIIFPNGLDDIK